MATNLSDHLTDDSITTTPLVGIATDLFVVRYNNTSNVLIRCNALASLLSVLARVALVSVNSCLVAVKDQLSLKFGAI